MIRTLLLTKFICLFLILTSCSTIEKKKTKRPRTYSQSVEDEFQSIENDQREILDHYRKLRQRNWDTYTDKSQNSPNRQYRSYQPKKKSYQKRQAKPAVKKLRKIPHKKALSQSKVEEFQIEMQQYMNYYCMKNRGSSRFSNEADCSAYTSNVLNDCEQKSPVIYDRSIVKCVKRKLD